MRGAFFGLNVAVRGLFAAQRNLDVINHNMSNVNTPGYSKQYGVQQAGTPIPLYDGTGMVGTGAEVSTVKRFRDEFLDFKYWSEKVSSGEWKAKKEVLAELEVTFNEPSPDEASGSGFTKIMNEFYNIMQELTKNPGDLSVRSAVRQKAVTLCKYFNSMGTRFEKLQEDLNHRISTKVSEVNTLASQIGQLNKQIYNAELDGNKANDLRDQRIVLVDKLSNIANIQASEVVVGTLVNGAENRQFVVTVSGKALVDHYRVTKIKTVARESGEELNNEDTQGLYDIMWEDGNSVNIKGGELKGYLDIRDGNEGQVGPSGEASPMYKGIPYYIRKLNDFVKTFARAFDKGIIGDPAAPSKDEIGHSEGFGLNGKSGKNFFTRTDNNILLSTAVFEATGNGYDKLTAKNIAVSADVMDDLDLIVTSSAPNSIEQADILKTLINFRHEKGMFMEGTPEDFMKSLVVGVGIDSQQAKRIYSNQDTVVKQIGNQRLSISGVSIDEEMADMIKYQNAYNACAKMITTMAEIYDTLINRTGV